MLLDLSGIQKCFGGVTALRDGNLRVSAGEVHLLLGENGAGKSTLMKIVAGIERRDAGGMLWQERTAASAADDPKSVAAHRAAPLPLRAPGVNDQGRPERIARAREQQDFH